MSISKIDIGFFLYLLVCLGCLFQDFINMLGKELAQYGKIR